MNCYVVVSSAVIPRWGRDRYRLATGASGSRSGECPERLSRLRSDDAVGCQPSCTLKGFCGGLGRRAESPVGDETVLVREVEPAVDLLLPAGDRRPGRPKRQGR